MCPSRVGRILSLLLVFATTLSCGSPQPSPPNILLITIDTLRADHLSSYGYARDTSPNMDALAARGVRFDQAWVQWPKTTPSIASLMTATYPKDNGIVRAVGQHVPGEFRLLAEELRELGYRTGAVVANGAIGSEFRFDQGFDTFLETWKHEPVPEDGTDQNRAEVVSRLARSILEQWTTDEPYFLWLHYLDPHWPYWPPEGSRGERFRYFEEPPDPATVQRLRIHGEDTRQDRDLYVALYDAEIRYVDAEIGRMLAWMEGRGELDNTLIVVTSDHGESLGEHNYYYDHGKLGFENTLRVPLILLWPDRLPVKVESLPVSLIDLEPTLLELAGVELEDGLYMQGRSFRRRLLAPEPASASEPVYAYAEAGYATRGRWQKIVRDQRHKLIYAPFAAVQRFIGGRKQPFGLYDLVEDPGEEVNLIESEPEVFQRLHDQLRDWWVLESFDVRVDPADSQQGEGMTEETRKQLEALGYL